MLQLQVSTTIIITHLYIKNRKRAMLLLDAGAMLVLDAGRSSSPITVTFPTEVEMLRPRATRKTFQLREKVTACDRGMCM